MNHERLPITVIVLTHDEERNLPTLLASVRDWAGAIVVVDSGSTDATPSIARAAGAIVHAHEFSTHARQWAWALENVAVVGDWVLALDADQSVTPELRSELRRRLARADVSAVSGFFVPRRQVFRGTPIRHGGYDPKYLLKLFRRGRARVDQGELVDHHFIVDGRTEKLEHGIIEANAKEEAISVWIAKHNRYAELQARQEFSRTAVSRPMRLFGTPDERIQWMRVRVWERLPLYVRPLLYFLYRYVVRLGFLDGRDGFVFHFLQGYWYRLLVDINLDELRRGERGEREATPRC